jgi:hypothetical protein
VVGERRPAGIQGIKALRGSAAAHPGSTALKVIAWVLGISALVALMSIGSCAYFDYRARKRRAELPQMTRNETARGGVPAPPMNPREVCSLVSNAEAGAALGTIVSSTNKGTSVCQYTSSVGRTLTVELTPQAGSLTLWLSAMAMRRTKGGSGVVHKLLGIGDEAYVDGKGSRLMFRKGNTMVNLEAHTDGNSFPAVIAIARKIATRLQ